MEVYTDCVRPWHVYTLLFGVFWLLSAYFDNFVISFLLCVIGGFISEILNKSIPIRFRPLSSETSEALQVSSQSAPQETTLLDSFYDKPLPPEPLIEEVEEAVVEDVAAEPQHQEVRPPSPIEDEKEQGQVEKVVAEEPEPEIRSLSPVAVAEQEVRPPSPIETVEPLREPESPVEKEAQFFGSDPIPPEASLSALQEQFNAKDSSPESESDNEAMDPEPMKAPTPTKDESRSQFEHSAGLGLELEPEKEPELEERLNEHNLLDDEVSKPSVPAPPADQEEQVIPVIEQQSESLEAHLGRHSPENRPEVDQHQKDETSRKPDPIDFDDDCKEDQEDLIRKKRAIVEDDFEASFEKERTPPRSLSPEPESKTVLDDLPHIPNKNSDSFEPDVMEHLKEEYNTNVEKAKEILPDSLLNLADSPTKSRYSSDEEDKAEPETAKASEEPFSFSKIGDKLEEMKGDIMGHFANKNDSDHEDEKKEETKSKVEESPIKVEDLQPKSSSPKDPFEDLLEKKQEEDDDFNVLSKESPLPSPSQDHLIMDDGRRSPLQPEMSTSAQNQANVMDLLDDAQKESISPKSVSPTGIDHSKGLSMEDEDEISDPLEAERKVYEQMARDHGGSDPSTRPLDVLSVSTTDTTADDISHRAVFGDDQEQDADQLDEVLDRQDDNDQSAKDSGSESENLKLSPEESSPKGIMGLGSHLANFAKENIIEPVKESIHPEPTKADSPPAIDIDLNDPLVEVAATKIQAAFKGYRTRSQMKMTT